KVVKKAAPKKVAKKVAQKVVPKAAPKKIIKKVAAKKATPTKVAKKVAVKKSIAKVEKKIAAPKKVAAKTVGPKKPAKNVAAKKAAPKKVEAKGALKKSSKKEKVIIEQENEDELDLADTSKSIKPEDVIDVVIDSAAVESDAKKVKKRTNEQVVKESITDEILALSEDFGIHDILSSIKTMDFFSTESGECLEKGCENPETTMGYCRYHYIKNWMEVKKKQGILEEGKLHSLIQELVEKFPVKNLEAILNDLVDDKTFFKVLQELNIEGGGPGTEDGQDENFDDDDSDFAFEAKGGSKPSFNEE
ncbi:MAG: hypothetical protein KAG61_11400, partial [Bacteriovoracaceae bacterium]|nr:hypothetical protein [Bacteriovoracaceae bacterium]